MQCQSKGITRSKWNRKKKERDPGKEKGIAKWDSRGKRVKNKRSDALGVKKKGGGGASNKVGMAKAL